MSTPKRSPGQYIEAKVVASGIAAAAVGLGVSLLNDLEGNQQLLGSLPGWAQYLLLILVPPILTFAAGWQAKHTPRPDLAASEYHARPLADPATDADEKS